MGAGANELCCFIFSCPWGPSLAYLGCRYLGGGATALRSPYFRVTPRPSASGAAASHGGGAHRAVQPREAARAWDRGAGEGRQTDGQAEGHTEADTDTGRQTQRQTDRDRNRERQIDR